MKLPMRLALLALAAVAALPSAKAGEPTCDALASCVQFSMNELSADACDVGGDCPVEVCMLVDGGLCGKGASGTFSHMCSQSDSNGCPRWLNDDGVTPILGVGPGDDVQSCSSVSSLTGENGGASWTGKCGAGNNMLMCQEGKPGDTLYWILKDGNDKSGVIEDKNYDMTVNGCTESVRCFNNVYACGGTETQKLKERTFAFTIPDGTGNCPSPCAAGTSGPEETPEWVYLACGRGRGGCGDTSDIQDKATSKHEVRCCSTEKINNGWLNKGGVDTCSGIYSDSELKSPTDDALTCHHTATYEEAVAICAANSATLCTKEQVEAQCARGSGCGHDGDMIWTSTEAPPRDPPPTPEPREDGDWLWLACGSPGKCGSLTEFQVQANTTHEVRCCSDHPVGGWKKNSGCSIWTESELVGDSGVAECFHDLNYADAQQLCYDNGGYICTKEQVMSGCAKASGCGHDRDMIWTSSDAPARVPPPFPEAKDPEEWLWLSCGRPGGCGDLNEIQVQAKEKFELRCCSSSPISGWKQNAGCDIYTESDLLIGGTDEVSCFHEVTYAEAQQICYDNGGYICTKEEVEAGCAKGSGCGHDTDLIWTSNDAPARPPQPGQEPRDPDEWLWLSCGRPGGCGSFTNIAAQAKESHEVRCCSQYPVPGWIKQPGCSVWTESDLKDENGHLQCFHGSTYIDAQQICANNGGYVCTKEEVELGCAKGTGCGHDADLIWTSTNTTEPEPVVFPNTDPVNPEDWIWLACGRGKHECGIGVDIQIQASETAELRCCSPLPVSGWKKNGANCDVWHESDLIGLDGEEQCFHDVTYAEAQEICAINGGHVCTREQIESGCAKGSGCGHDGDLIWTGELAPSRTLDDLPFQEPVDEDAWMWLACGRGQFGCGIDFDVQARASEKHEVRCCSDYPLEGWIRKTHCSNWQRSKLVDADGNEDTCFHASTYAEAQAVCRANGGYVCSKEQVDAACARGSGCGHDLDHIWTSSGPAPPRPTSELPAAVPDDMNLFLACGAGEDGCDGFPVGVAKPTERHEVRCCTPYPLNSWKKGGGNCRNYHESELLPVDAVEGTEPQCFHASTYAEAQAICHANDAYVCTVTEVLDQCARGSGCGHDADLVWTRSEATPEAVATYNARKTQAASISGVCIAAKGRISGDPHFTTFDQYRYDCQGTGEFVIAMSKGSDPLAIHGRFVRTVDSRIKPTITKAVAIKVVDLVPTIHVQAPPQKVNGMCELSYTIGEDETPVDDIVAFVNENYNGTASAFSNGRNIIFTFDDVKARIQITGGGGGNRCVLNTNLCLTPESHGGAENIVGLLGSPDGNKDNDWMNRDGSITPLPEVCNVPNPTSSEQKHCRTQRNIQGHEWCMDNWCVGHSDNSLWSAATHAEYNQCENRQPDDFFENVEEADPAIVEACEDSDAEDVDGCVIDTIICVEGGKTIAECIAPIEEDDRDANIVETLGQRDPSEQLEGWDGPVVSHTNAITLEREIVLEVPETPPAGGNCPVCRARGWGDPHIVTFDGLTYDVHVKGELTFLKSTDPTNDFTIQARTVAVKNHPRGPAVTSGVVVFKTGEPTVQVSLAKDEDSELANTFVVNGNSCPVQLFVDGVARDISSGSGVDGATVQIRGSRIVVEYLNLQMRMDMSVRSWRNECHFSVTYFLADCPCDGSLVGILGQPDGEWINDWHEHDGTPVDIPRNRRKRRGKPAYDYSLTWCLAAEDSHFEYEPEMSHGDFDKCTGNKGDENYDVDPDQIIEDAEKENPEIIEKCTGTDGELDEGCVIECVYLGEGACDEYVEIVQNTATAEIPQTSPTSGPTSGPTTSPVDDIPDFDDIGGNDPNDPNDPNDEGTSDNDNTSPTEGQGLPCTTFAPDGSCITDSAGSLGDPHFKTWVGEHYEYHGQCDLLLTKDKNFADGIGLEVQIRTKLVRFWSYIKRAAIRIGDDILEVEGVADIGEDKTNHYWFNFDFAAEAKTIGGFPLTIVNNKAKKRIFEIDLSSKYPGQKIVISTFREFVRVDFKQATAEAFGNAVGMMGDFKTGNLLARDGVREIDDFLDLGNEWQLLPSDDMLFHDKGEPQFPKRCLVPEDPQGQRRRRLGESTITVEEAESACANAGTALDIKDCVYDILATQDLEMAGAF